MATAEAFKSDGDGSQEKFFRKLGAGGAGGELGRKSRPFFHE
jgi:hypothetical protein